MPRRRYDCPFCPAVFTRNYNRVRHIETTHAAAAPVYPCYLCPARFNALDLLQQHVAAHTPQNRYVRKDGLEGAVTTYTRDYLRPGRLPIASLELTLGRDHQVLREILAYEAALKRYAKCHLIVIAEFVKVDLDGKVLRCITLYLHATTFALNPYQDCVPLIRRCHAEVAINLEDFVTYGSGWMLYGVHRTQLQVVRCLPLSGGCGAGDTQISVSHRVDIAKFRQISMHDDKMCFYRSVARHFVGRDNRDELDRYIRANLRTAGFELPFRVDRIAAFERLHADTLNFCINVVFLENGGFYPAYVSTRHDAVDPHVINLLLYHQHVGSDVEEQCHRASRASHVWERMDWRGRPIENDFSAVDSDEGSDDDDDDDEDDGRVEAHYAYISNVSTLMKRIYRGRKEKKGDKMGVGGVRGGIGSRKLSYGNVYFCPNCLNKFTKEKNRDEHLVLCRQYATQRTAPPSKGRYIEFRKHKYRFRVPLIGFFDFEAVQVAPENRCTDECADPSTCYHRSTIGDKSFVVSNQEAGTYSLVILDYEDRIVHKDTYSGSDAAGHFVQHLLDIQPTLEAILNRNVPMHLTSEEELTFQLATHCHICGGSLTPGEDGVGGIGGQRDAVRDHCHLSGRFEGAAHNQVSWICNKSLANANPLPPLPVQPGPKGCQESGAVLPQLFQLRLTSRVGCNV